MNFNYVKNNNDKNQQKATYDQKDRRGNKIMINDIIEYIEKNVKYISQPLLLKIDDEIIKNKIEPLNYKNVSILKELPKNLDSIFNPFEFKDVVFYQKLMFLITLHLFQVF